MRPRELTLAGFRSYREPATFDLRGRRLVGVVGPIGAGKSSLLDAVSFALYGKTPSVERDTRSLIHQLCDQCHVQLRFEVDGDTWVVQRALRKKGQAGHKLERLAADEPDANTAETITGERAVNARVEQLLGMDFKAFCRSVMLAQNRFNEFLHATPGDRDRVLKGVFGYERLDEAQRVAKSRLDRERTALESLAQERERIEEARGRLEEARAMADRAAIRRRALESATPEVDRLEREQRFAVADAEAAAAKLEELEMVTGSLGQLGDVETVVRDAATAEGRVAQARASVESARVSRAEREAELADVRSRLGDRERFRSFERLVQTQDEQARTREKALAAGWQAERDAEAAHALVGRLTAEAAEAAEALARSDEQLGIVIERIRRARTALTAAAHADMAHELRSTLAPGDPCPVCDRPVIDLPALGSGPTAVVEAEAELATAEAAEVAARECKERSAEAKAAARTATAAARDAVGTAASACQRAHEEILEAEAELAATQSQLVEWLGEGDAHELLQARESALIAAELALEEAGGALDEARLVHEGIRDETMAANEALGRVANRLSGTWGRLGEGRDVPADPDAVRTAFVEVGEVLVARLGAAAVERAAADVRTTTAGEQLVALLGSLGCSSSEGFRAACAEATAVHASALGAVTELERQVSGSSDLERNVVAAEARLGLAARLTEDLKPSRFLAFLLQEERGELAELGSEHFEQLTDGGYRFAGGDGFDVVDLNAAGQSRSADSLSGGETFLASLALALALAEMVARGGGALDAFFLDEGFGSLDPEHLDRAMDGIERLVSDGDRRLVVLVSHVAEMREALEDLIVLEKDDLTGDTIVRSGASRA